jgi:hypothetical protein
MKVLAFGKTLRKGNPIYLKVKILKMIETTVLENTYEKERNKPMPSKNHGKIQSNVLFQLMSKL